MLGFFEKAWLKSEATVANEVAVRKWLETHGWGEYVNQFNSQAVHDLATLRMLTQDDLKAMGVARVGDRRKMLSQLQADFPGAGEAEANVSTADASSTSSSSSSSSASSSSSSASASFSPSLAPRPGGAGPAGVPSSPALFDRSLDGSLQLTLSAAELPSLEELQQAVTFNSPLVTRKSIIAAGGSPLLTGLRHSQPTPTPASPSPPPSLSPFPALTKSVDTKTGNTLTVVSEHPKSPSPLPFAPSPSPSLSPSLPSVPGAADSSLQLSLTAGGLAPGGTGGALPSLSEDERLCSICDDNAAVIHCRQCEEDFCAECEAEMHVTPGFRNHKRVPLPSVAGGGGFSASLSSSGLSPLPGAGSSGTRRSIMRPSGSVGSPALGPAPSSSSSTQGAPPALPSASSSSGSSALRPGVSPAPRLSVMAANKATGKQQLLISLTADPAATTPAALASSLTGGLASGAGGLGASGLPGAGTSGSGGRLSVIKGGILLRPPGTGNSGSTTGSGSSSGGAAGASGLAAGGSHSGTRASIVLGLPGAAGAGAGAGAAARGSVMALSRASFAIGKSRLQQQAQHRASLLVSSGQAPSSSEAQATLERTKHEAAEASRAAEAASRAMLEAKVRAERVEEEAREAENEFEKKRAVAQFASRKAQLELKEAQTAAALLEEAAIAGGHSAAELEALQKSRKKELDEAVAAAEQARLAKAEAEAAQARMEREREQAAASAEAERQATLAAEAAIARQLEASTMAKEAKYVAAAVVTKPTRTIPDADVMVRLQVFWHSPEQRRGLPLAPPVAALALSRQELLATPWPALSGRVLDRAAAALAEAPALLAKLQQRAQGPAGPQSGAGPQGQQSHHQRGHSGSIPAKLVSTTGRRGSSSGLPGLGGLQRTGSIALMGGGSGGGGGPGAVAGGAGAGAGGASGPNAAATNALLSALTALASGGAAAVSRKQLEKDYQLRHPLTGEVVAEAEALLALVPTASQQLHAARGRPEIYGGDEKLRRGTAVLYAHRRDLGEAVAAEMAEREREAEALRVTRQASMVSISASAFSFSSSSSSSTSSSTSPPTSPAGKAAVAADEAAAVAAEAAAAEAAVLRDPVKETWRARKQVLIPVDLVLFPTTQRFTWSEHATADEQKRLLRRCKHCNGYYSEDQNLSSRACRRHPERAVPFAPGRPPTHPCCGNTPFDPPRPPPLEPAPDSREAKGNVVSDDEEEEEDDEDDEVAPPHDDRDGRCAPCSHDGALLTPLRLRPLAYSEREARRKEVATQARLSALEAAQNVRRRSAVVRADMIRASLLHAEMQRRLAVGEMKIHVFDTLPESEGGGPSRLSAAKQRQNPWFTINYRIDLVDEKRDAAWDATIWLAIQNKFRQLNKSAKRKLGDMVVRHPLSLLPVSSVEELEEYMDDEGNVDLVLYTAAAAPRLPDNEEDVPAHQRLASSSPWWTVTEKGAAVRVCKVCGELFQNVGTRQEDMVPELVRVGCTKFDLIHPADSQPLLPVQLWLREAKERKAMLAQYRAAVSEETKSVALEGLAASLLQAYDDFSKHLQEETESEDEDGDGLGDDWSSDDEDEDDDPGREFSEADRKKRLQQLRADELRMTGGRGGERGRGWRLFPGTELKQTPKQAAELATVTKDRRVIMLRVFENNAAEAGKASAAGTTAASAKAAGAKPGTAAAAAKKAVPVVADTFGGPEAPRRRGKTQPPLFTVPVRLTDAMSIAVVKYRVKRAWEDERGNAPHLDFEHDVVLRHPVSGQQFIAVSRLELKTTQMDHSILVETGQAKRFAPQPAASSSAPSYSSSGSSHARVGVRRERVPWVDEQGPGEALINWVDKSGRVDVVLCVGKAGTPAQSLGPNTAVDAKPGAETHATRAEIGAAVRECWRCGVRFCLDELRGKKPGSTTAPAAATLGTCSYHPEAPVPSFVNKSVVSFPCCKTSCPADQTGPWFGDGAQGPAGEVLGHRGPNPCVHAQHAGHLLFPLRFFLS